MKSGCVVKVSQNVCSVHLPATLFGFPWPVGLALETGICALVAWVAPRGRAGAAAGLAFSLAAFFLPIFVVAEPRSARAAVAFLGVLCVMRFVDLMRGARLNSFGRRLWFVVTPFDIRQVTYAPRFFDRTLALATAGYALLAIMSVIALRGLPPGVSPAPLLLGRWLIGALLCYVAADALVGVIRLGYGVAGIVPPQMHRAPILSKSIQEFWGDRWNRPVHEWLWRHCFRPIARRVSPALGVAAVFAASTMIHIWTVFFGAGLNMAMAAAAFFVLQGVLLIMEHALRVRDWSTLAARAWTVVCILGPSPLFVEPVLRVVGL